MERTNGEVKKFTSRWQSQLMLTIAAVQKIKQDLIHKAKVKKQYAKVKKQIQAEKNGDSPQSSHSDDRDERVAPQSPDNEGYDHAAEVRLDEVKPRPDGVNSVHSDDSGPVKEIEKGGENGTARQRISLPSQNDLAPRSSKDASSFSKKPAQDPTTRASRRRHNPRPSPYQGAQKQASRIHQEKADRRAAHERAEKEREIKREERERRTSAMMKAKGLKKNGQLAGSGKRKLGLESRVLLDKVKALVDEK